jgi:hypothetical protein
MPRIILYVLVSTVCIVNCSAYDRGAVPGTSSPDGEAIFEKLTSLQGEWVATPAHGVTYISHRLASGGSALVETMTAGEPGMAVPPAMMSVYHLDNGRLMMTHYCGQGNQPRMRVDKADGERVHFTVMDVTNLPNPEASHMVAVTFIFKDADHFTQEWVNRAAGKEEKWIFEFSRVKSR